MSFAGLLGHHFQANIAGGHFLHILDFRFSDYLSEEEQNLGLSIRECVALNMVAVIVEINCEPPAQQFPVPVRKRLQGIPTVHYRLYFIHIILPLICEISCLKVYTIYLLSHLFANILKFFKEYKQFEPKCLRYARHRSPLYEIPCRSSL